MLYTMTGENTGTVTGMYTGDIPSGINGGIYIASEDPIRIDYPNIYPVLKINLVTRELYYDYESTETIEMRLATVISDLSDLKKSKTAINAHVEFLNRDLTYTQVGLTETYEKSIKLEEDDTSTQIAVTEVYEELLKTQAALSTVNLAIQTLQTEIAKLKGE